MWPCCCRGLQAAVDGLRGEGPLVSVQLEIRNDLPTDSQQPPTPAAQTTPDAVSKAEEPMTGPATKSLSRSVFSPDRRRGLVGSPPSDSVLPFKGMGLLARLGFCRRPFSDDEADSTAPPKPIVPAAQQEPHVRVRIRVRSYKMAVLRSAKPPPALLSSLLCVDGLGRKHHLNKHVHDAYGMCYYCHLQCKVVAT